MSALIRGRPTAPSSVPRHWTGPLPDLSIRRQLPFTSDAAGVVKGYAEVPLSLLHGGFQDLAVLVWTQLRLWFDDREGKTSYYELAEALGVDSGKPSAVKAKFSAALQSLLGSWIERRRVSENQFAYRAVMPATRERYAMIRRWDLALLSRTRGTRSHVKPADIVDFARWQLECGQRGWTADSAASIADRWRVTPPTIRASRRRLESLGLLKVVPRDHRLTELTWLQELYDPHWMVPSQTTIEPRAGLLDGKKTLTLGSATEEKKPDLGEEKSLTLVGKKTSPPIEELSSSLADDDLTGLGGTSVPPLTSVTREIRDAPPPASRGKSSARGAPSSSRTAGQILGSHPALMAAPKHYRAAMHRRLCEALERGLEPEHAARAVDRVVEDGEVERHCEILRQALQQAWADHHAGMCGTCFELSHRHAPGCGRTAVEVEMIAADGGLGPVDNDVPDLEHLISTIPSADHRRAAGPDPLQLLIERPVDDLDRVSDDAGAVAWLTREFAVRVAAADDQLAFLAELLRSARRERPKQAHLIGQAAEHVRYAVEQRTAGRRRAS